EDEGEAFLEDIGIERGQKVLDFGCGAGHYTIPAAKVVEEKGMVYALDKDAESLEKMARLAETEGLKNIVRIHQPPQGREIGLEYESIDAILLFDVLHYLNRRERKELYGNAYRVLKRGGILSVYPKHCKSDEALWNLADLEAGDIADEIESSGFRLEEKILKRLVHDENFDRGYVLIHRKPAG
ncbi:MAG: class I SAM-dependent methyltransferase, partial [Actinomycetota bacterium]